MNNVAPHFKDEEAIFTEAGCLEAAEHVVLALFGYLPMSTQSCDRLARKMDGCNSTLCGHPAAVASSSCFVSNPSDV